MYVILILVLIIIVISSVLECFLYAKGLSHPENKKLCTGNMSMMIANLVIAAVVIVYGSMLASTFYE